MNLELLPAQGPVDVVVGLHADKPVLDACCGSRMFWFDEHRVPVATVLSLTPEKPLFGQRCGTTAKTHWLVFMKPNVDVTGAPPHEQEPKR